MLLSRYWFASNTAWLSDGTDDEASCLNWNLQGILLLGTGWKSPNPKLMQIQCKVCFNFCIKSSLFKWPSLTLGFYKDKIHFHQACGYGVNFHSSRKLARACLAAGCLLHRETGEWVFLILRPEARHKPLLRMLYSCVWFEVCTLSYSWLMRWLGLTSFPKGPQLWSCPVWSKMIINFSTNPFRLKMRFRKMSAKCTPIPWEQVQCIFHICICKIILNILIYFYEHLSLHKVSTANDAPLLDYLCSNPSKQ